MLDVKKLLKKAVKRKVRVTDALIVGFLISGNLLYAQQQINEDFTNDETISDGIVLIENNININNSGVIHGTNGVSGINEGKDEEDNIIINNIGDINNSGVIIGFSDSENSESGNGISNPSGNIGKINNTGIITGHGSNQLSGNGIYSAIDIGNINNKGVLAGFSEGAFSSSGSVASGNGVTARNQIKDIENSGIIKGSADSNSQASGNGILIPGGVGIGEIKNNGIISGSTYNESTNNPSGYNDGGYTGSGIYSYARNGEKSTIGDVNNNGVISGYFSNPENSYNTSNAGHGLGYFALENKATIGAITNSGIIKGSSAAIFAQTQGGVPSADDKTTNIKGNNYGILAGINIFEGNVGRVPAKVEIENKGMYISLAYETINGKKVPIIDADGPRLSQISIAENSKVVIDGTEKTIINGRNGRGAFNPYEKSSDLTDNINLIINGVGRGNSGALTVDKSISLNNSIINGYETALYVQNDKSFTGTDVIFNGGGLKNDIAVIKGDGGANTLNISGNSIINGAVDLGGGNDTLTLDNSVQINGTLTGGTGDDTLNLGLKNSTSSLSIYHDISDFESVNTNGNITIYETADIIGANVNIQSGNLTFRIDPTLKDDDGFITGHAFYREAVPALDSLDKVASSSPTITSTGGYLVLGLNGLGENSTINMGGYTLIPDIDDKWWKPSDYLTTDSLVLDAKLKDDGNILVTVKESIPLEPPINPEDPEPPVNPSIDPELYAELNKVYQSIVNAGEIGVLANTTLLEGKTYEEALEALLSILDQIHANNPYAYTLKSSRDSLKLFEDNLSYLTIKPKENEWIVQGKGFYSGVKNDNSKSSEGCYEFNKAYRNYETKTSFSGGLATAEYGLTNNSSVGFVLGGGHQSTDFKGSSKIKGNSLYLGAFAKKEINQFKFMSGIGYQYGSLKGERVVTNKYNYFKTDDRYDVNSFNVFVESKYDYALNNDWTLSPKAKLSWYYVSQDSVNEGYEPGNLSLKVDSATGNTGDLEIGFDLKNTLALNSGKLSNILSVGLINTIGDREKDLTGNILGTQKNGNSFDIRGIELPRTSGKLSYNLEYEKTNGMIYTLGVGYEFAKDNNKNITATVGLGYKF